MPERVCAFTNVSVWVNECYARRLSRVNLHRTTCVCVGREGKSYRWRLCECVSCGGGVGGGTSRDCDGLWHSWKEVVIVELFKWNPCYLCLNAQMET